MNWPLQIVILWSDVLFWSLLAVLSVLTWRSLRVPRVRQQWITVGSRPVAMASATVLSVFLLVGMFDSLHFRLALPAQAGIADTRQYSVEVLSVLDFSLRHLKRQQEKSYSAPLATHLFVKESRLDGEGHAAGRDFPPLRFGGQHLQDPQRDWLADVGQKAFVGLMGGVFLWWLLAIPLHRRGSESPLAWGAVSYTLLALLALIGPLLALSTGYHVFGTDKVGQDVLLLTLKSIRTGLLIGCLTTLVLLPIALLLGILAGYLGGWVDDGIQYLYTTLNSIPGVLLIAASVLMMQIIIDGHPQWFATAAERSDARLLALCLVLGMTSWTGLARLLRAETLKLRELDYVQAARAFGVAPLVVMARHILPNLMHLVVITVVMDFSGLVLAEAVLSYVGVGVDAGTVSFGNMINAARRELAREPTVWWSLAAAFSFMFALVLAANLLADVVREAFDPKGLSARSGLRFLRKPNKT